MKYILDTHCFIWSLLDTKKLSQNVKKTLTDSRNAVYVSVVSFWEISIKYAAGKIELGGITPDALPQKTEESDIAIIKLLPTETSTFFRLPKVVHKDPFDRMLIWQAINNDLTLVTKDRDMQSYKQYGLKTLW